MKSTLIGRPDPGVSGEQIGAPAGDELALLCRLRDRGVGVRSKLAEV